MSNALHGYVVRMAHTPDIPDSLHEDIDTVQSHVYPFIHGLERPPYLYPGTHNWAIG